ncbi:MAG: hypothetical protein GDA43_19815 [Hormoscilla sp. SP5CHS1]|nr:hypothetical protein [Hormoscilla sp. SP12CHS1]MBC6455167.1 hypothetical protein [Hormoscilla sp. SP5CHS1]
MGIITTEKLTQAQEKLTGTVPEKSETSLGTGITGYFVDGTCGANCSDATHKLGPEWESLYSGP